LDDCLGETCLDPIDITEPKKPAPARELPPHISGIGTPEDSEQSCHFLTPTAPKRDFARVAEYGDVVLHYEAIVTNEVNEDGIPTTRGPFLVKYFMLDDTAEIHEQVERPIFYYFFFHRIASANLLWYALGSQLTMKPVKSFVSFVLAWL
jgi:hypothetical protein